MDNKVSELNSENVANVNLGHSTRPRPRADPVLNDMYLGLHKSVSATRGNHTGLAKPVQLSQLKQIQPKTKYTCIKSPDFIPRQQCFYTFVRSLSFIPSRPLPFGNCLKPVSEKKSPIPKYDCFQNLM